MTNLHVLEAILLSLAAGLAIPLGGLAASLERVQPAWLENELRHAIISFGGGALLAAVALVLIPPALDTLSLFVLSLTFLAGAVIFMSLSYLLSTRGGSVSQVLAMLLDFIPEAMALGATVTKNASVAIFLAFIIGLQNFPEGFNAYREIKENKICPSCKTLVIFTMLALVGPFAAIVGYYFLADHETLLHIIMVFCAGGILYLIFQDIAPQAKLQKKWAPSLGAVGGFMLGIIGYMMTSG